MNERTEKGLLRDEIDEKCPSFSLMLHDNSNRIAFRLKKFFARMMKREREQRAVTRNWNTSNGCILSTRD